MYARTLIYTKKIFSLKFLYFIILPYSRNRKVIYKSSGTLLKIIPIFFQNHPDDFKKGLDDPVYVNSPENGFQKSYLLNAEVPS